MNIRKLQKTGKSTMIVSLPSSWISEHRLKPGDAVTVHVMNDGTLRISPIQSNEDELIKKTIQVEKEDEEHLIRKLIAAYIAGSNVIEIRSKDRLDLNLKRTIKEFSQLVIGPEVIEETSNSIVLHDLSDPMELPQQKCIRRMHLLAKSMHADALKSLKDGDYELAMDVIERDREIDRLYWMVVKQYNLILRDRYLADKMGIDVFDGMDFVVTARGIERIGDHAEKIAGNTLLLKEANISSLSIDDISEISDISSSLLDCAIDAFFSKNVPKANDVIDKGKLFVTQAEKLRANVKDFTPIVLIVKTTVTDSITRIGMYSMDIAEIAINAAIRSWC